jgi:hypothetical protein
MIHMSQPSKYSDIWEKIVVFYVDSYVVQKALEDAKARKNMHVTNVVAQNHKPTKYPSLHRGGL